MLQDAVLKEIAHMRMGRYCKTLAYLTVPEIGATLAWWPCEKGKTLMMQLIQNIIARLDLPSNWLFSANENTA